MRRRFFLTGLIALSVFIVSACDQLAGLQNNRARIADDWHIYSGGFSSDSTYSFDEGIIKKDGFAWGTYSFVKSSEVEVSLGGTAKVYSLEFITDDEMIFYEMIDGERYDRYEWRRSSFE